MKKIIRLTESDLIRIVKKVIKENKESYNDDYRVKGKPMFGHSQIEDLFTPSELEKIKDNVLRLNNPGFFESYELDSYLDKVTDNVPKIKKLLINWLKNNEVYLDYLGY